MIGIIMYEPSNLFHDGYRQGRAIASRLQNQNLRVEPGNLLTDTFKLNLMDTVLNVILEKNNTGISP
jgi:hypothetical protein